MSDFNNSSNFEIEIKYDEISEALKNILIKFSSYIQNSQYVY